MMKKGISNKFTLDVCTVMYNVMCVMYYCPLVKQFGNCKSEYYTIIKSKHNLNFATYNSSNLFKAIRESLKQ